MCIKVVSLKESYKKLINPMWMLPPCGLDATVSTVIIVTYPMGKSVKLFAHFTES